MKNLFKISLFLLISTSCSNNKLNNMLINNDIFIVDLDKAEKKDTLFLSTLFKSVKCIPLETSDNSLMGRIDKILVFDKNIYVLDVSSAKGLFIFDEKGSFIQRVGNIGNGPGEYIRIIDFSIDTDKNEIIILDEARKLIFYDIFTCKYLRTVNTPNFPITSIQYFNGMLYADLHNYLQTPDDCLMQTIDLSTGKQIDKYLNTNEYNKGINQLIKSDMPYFIPSSQPPFLFRQLFMDTFISLTPQGIQPFLTVKSKNFVSEKELEGFESTRIRSLVQGDKIFSFISYFSHNDYIHFKYRQGFEYSVIYDTSLNKTMIYNFTYNDLLYNQQAQIIFQSVFFDKTGVYECISINLMSTFLRYIKEDKFKSEIKNQLTEIDEESNPVIFYYEFK